MQGLATWLKSSDWLLKGIKREIERRAGVGAKPCKIWGRTGFLAFRGKAIWRCWMRFVKSTRGQLDFVNCRNEGGAAFMAAAWGKLTGSPEISMVTRGPGVTNASIGIHTAMQFRADDLLCRSGRDRHEGP